MFILNNKNSPSLAIRFVLLFGIFTDENQTALLGELAPFRNSDFIKTSSRRSSIEHGD